MPKKPRAKQVQRAVKSAPPVVASYPSLDVASPLDEAAMDKAIQLLKLELMKKLLPTIVYSDTSATETCEYDEYGNMLSRSRIRDLTGALKDLNSILPPSQRPAARKKAPLVKPIFSIDLWGDEDEDEDEEE